MEAVRLLRALPELGVRGYLGELRYYYVIRPVGKFRPWLATKYPKWVVQDALIRAAVLMIDDNEVVPEVPVMTVLERWSKGTRPRKPARN